MLLPLFSALGVFIATGLYAAGLWAWIYRNRVIPGLFALCVAFPILLRLTGEGGWVYFRIIPCLGVGFFIHRYGMAALSQIRLLWFTTLSVMVVQAYYVLMGVQVFPK